MPKPVTEDRILAALDRADNFREAQIRADRDIMQHFMLIGLKQSMNPDADVKGDIDRLNLELDYQAIAKDPTEIQFIMERLEQHADRRRYHFQKVWAIQAKHNISGLEQGETTLGDATIVHWEAAEMFDVIASDLELLRQDKPRLMEFAIAQAMQAGMNFYKDDQDAWHITDRAELLAALPFYDWVQVWDSEHFGRDEIHIALGCGTNFDNPPSSAYYCACQGVPSR
jgi:hypothetical protein